MEIEFRWIDGHLKVRDPSGEWRVVTLDAVITWKDESSLVDELESIETSGHPA